MVIVTPTPALLITLNVEPVVLKVVAAPVLMPMVNRGVAPKAEPSGFRKLLAVIIPTVTSVVVFTPTPESLVIAIYLFSYLSYILTYLIIQIYLMAKLYFQYNYRSNLCLKQRVLLLDNKHDDMHNQKCFRKVYL